MERQHNSKVIAMYSPLAQSGQTTIANNIGLNLAERGYYVVVIELSLQTGYSVFLNRTMGEMERNLKECLVNPEKFNENVVRSSLHHRLFIVCQNLYATIGDLTDSYNTNLVKMINEAKELFDYVIIDLPNMRESESALKILGRNFAIDHTIYTVTENVMSLKLLNEFDSLLAKVNNLKMNERKRTTLVVNKSKGYYSQYFESNLANMERSEIVNIVNFRNIPELVYLGNEGKIKSLGKTPLSYEYFDTVTQLSDIVEKNVTGIGMSEMKESNTTKKLMGSRIIGGKSKEDEDLEKIKREGRRKVFGPKTEDINKEAKKPKEKKPGLFARLFKKKDKKVKKPLNQNLNNQGNSRPTSKQVLPKSKPDKNIQNNEQVNPMNKNLNTKGKVQQVNMDNPNKPIGQKRQSKVRPINIPNKERR